MPPRMNGWNEQTLRAAASWKAFKSGRSLFESGAVTDAKTTAAGWQGSVSAGRRPLRVSVAVKSATDLETRCPCPENRATGELCSHAVAAGLAALAAADSAAPAQDVLPDAGRTMVARELHLPSNWRESLKRGKLTLKATISRRASEEVSDIKLHDWFSREGVEEKPQVHLQLDEARLGAFLDAIMGHPAVFTGDGIKLEISDGHRLQLTHATRVADEASLAADENDRGWLEIAGAFWQAGEDFLRQAGAGTPPQQLGRIMAALCRGQSASLPVRDLLSHLEAWQDWLRFPTDCWPESLHFVPAAATFHLSLDGSLQQIEARLAVAYDGSPMQVPGKGEIPHLPRLRGEICEIRDLPGEQMAVNRLESAGFQAGEPGLWVLRGQSNILGFFAHSLPRWRRDPWLGRVWTTLRSYISNE